MTGPDPDDDFEAPLDPATANIQRKLRILILIGSLTMAVGLIAVFSAILYRTVKSERVVLPVWASGEMLIGSKSRVIGSSLDGDRAILTIDTPQGSEIMTLDLRTLTVISRVKLVPEPE